MTKSFTARSLEVPVEKLTKEGMLAELLCSDEKALILLEAFDNNITRILNASMPKLKQLGLTKRQARRVYLMRNLGFYASLDNEDTPRKVTNSRDCFRALRPFFINSTNIESFYICALNRSNKIIGIELISKGGVSGTVVDMKIVFKALLELGASNFILAHNHPSGNRQPSQADIDLTKKAKQAGKTLDMNLLDHIIVLGESIDNYYSFADEAML